MNTDNATMSPTAGQGVLKMSKKGRYKLIWKRYKRNKLAMVGMVVFLVMLLAVFGAPLYIDYDQAITQHIVDAFTAPGCRFANRCPYASEKCKEPQVLTEIAPNHFVACHECVK